MGICNYPIVIINFSQLGKVSFVFRLPKAVMVTVVFCAKSPVRFETKWQLNSFAMVITCKITNHAIATG
jgi:hypothetical protein